MIVGILFVQAVAFAVLSAIIASNKNRSVAGWGALGFLFGLFGFIAAIAVGEAEENQRTSRRRSSRKSPSSRKGTSSNKNQRQKSPAQEFDADEHEKKCPDCAEYIKLEARRCKHCGHEMSEEEVERQIEERKQEVEKERERFYCERSDITVEKNPDGTCPACGHQVSDSQHLPAEEGKDVPKKSIQQILDTHDFSGGRTECEKCGVTKSYVKNHRYECRRSE